MSSEFLLTSLIVVLMPGTGVIYTISTGLLQGSKASLAASFGCTMGIVPHLCASILGLAALLHLSALAFQVVKFIGVGYLLYLAYGMWKESGMITLGDKSSEKKLRAIAARGFLINILNPKLSIFFLAFLPQFISPTTTSVTMDMLMLSLVFMLMTLGVFIGYGLFAHKARIYIENSPKIMRRIQQSFAVMFVGLATKLALSER